MEGGEDRAMSHGERSGQGKVEDGASGGRELSRRVTIAVSSRT